VNVINKFGRTTLSLACRNGENLFSSVKLLVEGGADIEIADNDGKTAIDIARQNDHPEVVQYLERALEKRLKDIR
jgi:ankyrin repeat protein